MPCYLFTYHAYGTWMPDHRRGYVRRHKGVLAPDAAMADRYRRAMVEEPARFDADHQRLVIATAQAAMPRIECRLHLVATDATHIHILISWTGQRRWMQNRTSLKRALTIALKRTFGDRPWLVDGASRKRVRDRGHFDYLVTQYLPRHTGWKWAEGRGLFL